MRKILMLHVALVTFTAPLVQASGGGRKATVCMYESQDLGSLIGHGPNEMAAFDDAATKCFDRRVHLYKAKHGQTVDEDAGLAIIDACANIKCS